MEPWRLLIDDGAGAATGLALDEALMTPYGRTASAAHQATLRLYTYRAHCALIGRYQSLDAEVDAAACAERGISLGRRPTGGGAIIMGPEQLGVALATRAPVDVGPRELLAAYARGIIDGLGAIGIAATFRGKNDLTVDGRKIAGLGFYLDADGALLFHASVLVGLDVPLMLSALRIPGAKLADKGATRVGERITTVREQLGEPMDVAVVRAALAAAFAHTLHVTLEASKPSAAERRLTAELAADRYAAADWLQGREQPPGARGSTMLKTPGGLIRVYAGVQRDVLSSVMFTGDFSAMPPELIALEAALRWCRAEPARIAEVVRAHVGVELLGATTDAIADAVWAAAERALKNAGTAAPVRTEGSCYFPEPEAERSAA